MGFEIMHPEMVIENELGMGLGLTDLASTYALALRKPEGSVDWLRINTAIMEAHGAEFLNRVKVRAHDYIEGSKAFGT